MLAKIKTFFTSSSAKIYEVLAVVFGLLLYYIQLKNKEVNALRAQVALVQTQKQADMLETQIQNKLSDSSLLQKEIDEHNATLTMLSEKRKDLPEDDRDPTTYWKNN